MPNVEIKNTCVGFYMLEPSVAWGLDFLLLFATGDCVHSITMLEISVVWGAFGPVLSEPDSRARPFVRINSGKIENTLFFSLKGFSSFTLKSMSAFFYVTWECLGRQIVMLTEVEKRSSELSVCSNNKQASARCSAYGFSRKLLTKQFSLLYLDTPSFSPVCPSYHSLVVIKLSCSSFYL